MDGRVKPGEGHPEVAPPRHQVPSRDYENLRERERGIERDREEREREREGQRGTERHGEALRGTVRGREMQGGRLGPPTRPAPGRPGAISSCDGMGWDGMG